MFGKYALPSDILWPTTFTASPEASAYGAIQAVTLTSVRPSKLDATSGTWVATYSSPVELGALVLPYANFDEGLDVTFTPDGGTPIVIDCPGPLITRDDGFQPWPRGIVQEFDPQTSDEWTLSVNEANSFNPQIFKFLPFASLRQAVNDVSWGVVEEEEQGDIWHETAGGAVSAVEVWGPRRSFMGQFTLRDADVPEIVTLHRSVRQRILPWVLIPDADVNDAWFVRFIDPIRSQTRETINHHIATFRVKELSRGLPWP